MDLRNPATGYPMEIDVWLPDLKLGLEYQVKRRGNEGQGEKREVEERGKSETST